MKLFNGKLNKICRQVYYGWICLFLCSCATYQGKIDESRKLLEQGQFQDAIAKIEPLARQENNDQLVYLLDYSTALQISGKLAESNKAFLAADKLSDQLDYHSVSAISGSLIMNEEMSVYKGDTFEKIFINAYLAMNYLELGQLDDALVEARRINQKYSKLRSEDKKEFELNFFAKYLSALAWEANRSYDDAYIAFEEAYKIDPSAAVLREDLVRSAKLARRSEALKKWQRLFPEVEEKKEWQDSSVGELVLIYAQGWGPRKQMNPQDYRFPTLYPTYSQTQQALLKIDNKEYRTQSIYNVERAAIQTLQDDYAGLIGKRIAGRVAKHLVAEQVRQKDKTLGALTELFLVASDRADLRQWSTLPQTIQISRVYLKPGRYNLDLIGLTSSGTPTADQLLNKEIEIKAGKKTFISWRSLR